MKIVVDRNLCEGNGVCAVQAPELFALDENDELHVLKESFGAESLEHARKAVASCPKCALKIVE